LSIQAGQTLSFTTRVNAVPMAADYAVFIHFVDANGVQLMNADYLPPVGTSIWNGAVSYTQTAAIPATAAPGTYTIRMGFYQTQSPYNRVAASAGPGVTVDNALRYTVGTLTISSPSAAPTPTPSPGTGGSSVPVGGPGGYTNMKMNDSFGSSKAGANITSLSQFNSGTYGSSGSGWDDHMCAWDCGKANLAMSSDHLEIYPANNGSGFISSRFEYLPTGNQRIYYEIRATTGRGDQGGQTWPAFWFFAGNEPGSRNAQSEFDLMETYMSQQWGPYDSAAGGWAQHFVVTSHPDANSTLDSYSISTPGIDITINYNVYGCEVYRGSDGNLHYNIYFNGQLQPSPSQGLPWNSTPPSLFLGWNPGHSNWSPATMKIDYVKAWIK
jgi:hypothetical protein